MGLFDRVFRGSDEMFAKAEAEINAVVAQLGESAPMKMPDQSSGLRVQSFAARPAAKEKNRKMLKAAASLLCQLTVPSSLMVTS